MQRLTQNVSSAKQVSELAELQRQIELSEREEKAIHRRGVEEQISASATLSTLLKHNLEQAKQQEDRDRIDTKRHREMMVFTVIAAVTGIISLFLQWKGK